MLIDGCSRLPTRPDLSFDRQNINVIELVQEENLDNLPVKASDIATETSKDPVLKQVRQFVLKGWPWKALQKVIIPFFAVKMISLFKMAALFVVSKLLFFLFFIQSFKIYSYSMRHILGKYR